LTRRMLAAPSSERAAREVAAGPRAG